MTILNKNLSPVPEEDNKPVQSEEGLETLGTFVAAVTNEIHYVKRVDSETEISNDNDSESESESDTSSSDEEGSLKRRRHRRRRDRSLSRRDTRRRHYYHGNNNHHYHHSPSISKSRSRYYGATETDTSRSRSRSSSRSTSRSSSRDTSRSSSRSSYSRSRKYKLSHSKKSHHRRSRDYNKKGSSKRKSSFSRSMVPRTPKYWPKNAENNYSTPFVSNTLSHPQILMTSPRNFSTNDVRMGIRRRLQVFLDDPNSSKYAVSFALFIAFMVMISSIGVIIESLPQFYAENYYTDLWNKFEITTLVIFTSELVLRYFAHSTSWKQFNRFFWSFSNFIDVIAIAPIFIESIFLGSKSKDGKRFMVFRLFRLIKLLHCYGYSSVLQLSMDAMFIALNKSKDALLAILFFQFFVIIIFSTLIYFFERGTWDDGAKKFIINEKPSEFDSIPATFWFVAEVITTVGLGDVSPKTVLGKIFSFPLMLFGLLIIALPSIVLGKNFAEAWLWLKTSGNIQKQAMMQQKQKLKASKKEKVHSSKKEEEASMSAKDFAKEFVNGPAAAREEKQGEKDKKSNNFKPPEYSTAIDIDRMEKGDKMISEEKGSNREDAGANEEANEETNMETVRSDQRYFVSTEALIESENQNEILQLVQMLVEQFQQNTEVIERLSRQQDNLMGTVAAMKKAQMKMLINSGGSGGNTMFTSGEEYIVITSDERSRSRNSRTRSRSRNRSRSRSRSRSRDRTRSRSRNRTRSRSRDRTRSRSKSSRGRSHSKSLSRLTRSHSRNKSSSSKNESRRGRSRGNTPSPSTRSRSNSSSSSATRFRHRRRVSSCSTCEDRDNRRDE